MMMKTIAAIVAVLGIVGALSVTSVSAQRCIPQYDSSGAMTGCLGD
jgi:hypothetical protein